MNDFLSAVSRDDAGERRNDERVSGGDATASLSVCPETFRIISISFGTYSPQLAAFF